VEHPLESFATCLCIYRPNWRDSCKLITACKKLSCFYWYVQ